MAKGWVKLNRKFLEWEWFDELETTKLFLFCLLKANYEDTKWKGEIIKRGSFITSIKKLSDELSLSERTIRTGLSRLLLTKEIRKKATSKYTMITICKYDTYQGEEESERQTNDKPTTNQRQTNDKPTTTTKEYKEYKKERKNCLQIPRERNFEKPVEFLETETLNPPEDLIEEVKPLENNSNKFDGFISRFEKEFVNLPRYAEIGEAMDLTKIQLNNYFSEFITENKLSRKHQIFMFYKGFSAGIETHFVNWLRLKVNKNKGQIPETENNKRVERVLKSLSNARQ